jgi:hypothetical protein
MLFIKTPIIFKLVVLAIAGLAFTFIAYKSYPGRTLHNPETGATWYGRSLLGIELNRVVIPPHRLFNVSLPAPPSDYPASVAAMVFEEKAEYVLEVTILDLLARGIIRVERAQAMRSSLGGRPRPIRRTKYVKLAGSHMQSVRGEEYSLHPGPDFEEAAAVEGTLEGRIINSVTPQKDSRMHRNPFEAAMERARAEGKLKEGEQMPALPSALAGFVASVWSGPRSSVIRNVVWAVYDTSEDNPRDWLLDLVREDAARRGLGYIKKTMLVMKSFEPDVAYDMQLREAGRQLKSLHDRAREAYPDFFHALQEDVKHGIRSRVEVSSD